MFRLIQLLVLAVILYAPAVVRADPLVLIDFDTPLPSDLYLSQGVFITTIFIDPSGPVSIFTGLSLLPTPAAVSPPQAAFASQEINPQFPPIKGISGQFMFTTSEGVVVPGRTGFVSFNVVGSQGTWTALFFDTTNPNPFDVQTGLIGSITGNTDQLVVFSFSQGISRFVFIPSGLNVLEGIDNLQFEPTSVPEPASLLLLTFGIAGLLVRRRHERLHKSSKSRV